MPLLTFDAFVYPKISSLTPSSRIWKTEQSHISSLELADPRYNESLPIDILLGADVYSYIIPGNRLVDKENEPIALKTQFGWALMGNTLTTFTSSTTILFTSLDAVNTTLRRFWEIEEIPSTNKTSPAEQEYDTIYQNTTTRQSDGRYIVQLHFTCYPPLLGESQNNATKRLIQLESRPTQYLEFQSDYNDAMKDYLDSGHMRQVKSEFSVSSFLIMLQLSQEVKQQEYEQFIMHQLSPPMENHLMITSTPDQNYSKIYQNYHTVSFILNSFTADVKQMFRQILVTPQYLVYQRL